MAIVLFTEDEERDCCGYVCLCLNVTVIVYRYMCLCLNVTVIVYRYVC